MNRCFPVSAIVVLIFFSPLINCSKKSHLPPNPILRKNHIALKTTSSWTPGKNFPADLILIPYRGDSAAFWSAFHSWQSRNDTVGVMISTSQETRKSDFYRYLAHKFPDPDSVFSQLQQRDRNRNPIGNERTGWYMVPDSVRAEYFKEVIRRLVDVRMKIIVLEEPEYKVSAGYSSVFKRYWKKQTGRPWPFSSQVADDWYRTAELKQKMLLHFLTTIVHWGKEYAAGKNLQVHFFINSAGSIFQTGNNTVVPGIRGLKLQGVEGLIGRDMAENWIPIMYEGGIRSRDFISTYLQFSWLIQSLVSSNRRVYLPVTTGGDQRRGDSGHLLSSLDRNLIAALMQPEARHFLFGEPFPHRGHRSSLNRRQQAEVHRKIGLFFFLLHSLPAGVEADIRRVHNPWPRTGVVFSDTYQFQRGGPFPCALESFYQLAIPFLQHGFPIQVVPLENLLDDSYLEHFDVLVMSYEGYKPPSPEIHFHLRRWVEHKGGILFFYIGATGPFDEVEQWWTRSYDRPHEHLFKLLRIGLYPERGFHKVGRGIVYTERSSPRELAKTRLGGEIIWNTFIDVLHNYVTRDSLMRIAPGRLDRQEGPYRMVFVGDEVPEAQPVVFSGEYIDLLSDSLAIIQRKIIPPGQLALLFDLHACPGDTNQVLISSSRIFKVESSATSLRFSSRWIVDTPVITFVHLSFFPDRILCQNVAGEKVPFQSHWYETLHVLRLATISEGEPVQVTIRAK